MKQAFLFCALVILAACSGVKRTQEDLNTGNYGAVMDRAIRNIAENKTKKSNQPFIVLLESAFKKNTQRELGTIAFLQKDGNPAHFDKIYQSLASLNSFQDRISSLLPLYINDENREARFQFNNYDDDLLAAKDNLVHYLYDNANAALANARGKADYRNAYEDLTYLDGLHPNFKNTRELMAQAHAKGISYVLIEIQNNTDKVIPARLEDELLNMSTYGLDDHWTAYHTNKVNVDYDYLMSLSFDDIAISPEQIRERQMSKERQIKDGYQLARDTNGNIVKDSLGNEIKIDRFKTVRCDFYQFTQFKSAQVTGIVSFTDLRSQQQLDQYPLTSEFMFEHSYANYEGDKRALDNDLVALLQLARVPFPTNEQMVYDAGEDLKNNLKQILQRQRFHP
ncbi:hypothetical protein [Maribacter sp. 2307ULW6-5]|uniref:hypothetical protein n=1 Tax=Maribacter sp. 2307ULW6-5 TaxID=3386275 RepID=UPI0039BCA8DD